MHEAVRIFMRHGTRATASTPRERKNYRNIKFHSAGKREGKSVGRPWKDPEEASQIPDCRRNDRPFPWQASALAEI